MSEPDQDQLTPSSGGAFKGYVVAIGASAGGLDALERFFQDLPGHTGAAYVVIQHLSPDHKSMMVNLLGRHTPMPVVTVEDGMAVTADRVFLIPPANTMRIADGRLRLSPKDSRVLTLPIDLFFTSLAQEIGPHAVGVVLSGTGSDGTRGSLAINEAGGLLLAQDPETAKFDGMPRSVIATGLVDGVFDAEELGRRVLQHISQAPRARPPRREREAMPSSSGRGSALDVIQHLLRSSGGIDFRDYKPATVMRRIERRMKVRHVPSFDGYAELLEGDQAELATLRRELLIPVTSFFRDAEAFDVVAESAIATLVRERKDGQPLRIWVSGVSTGEEAYSLAILITEACERERRWLDFKVFATDVEQQTIDTAGAGVFPEAITAEVSAERLRRFFLHRANHFVIKPEIRQSIVFARHNLLVDPPFTRMDLVSCRNVLIYFEPDAQDRVLRRLQYALVPGGFLFLGSSESLASRQDAFTPVSSKHKLFKVLRQVSLPLDLTGSGLARLPTAPRRHRLGRPGAGNSDAAAIDAGLITLLRSYAPASLLLTRSHELLHVFGDVTRYLRFGEGSATLEVSKLLPPRLAPVALALLHKAGKADAPLRSGVLTWGRDGESDLRLRLVVRPVAIPQGETHLILSFEPEPEPEPAGGSGEALMETLDMSRETGERVQGLEKELAATRESLQATIEELETANEELQATNEELMAANEELQSSNEELQSVNEELYTVNAENQEKIGILNRLNADLDSLAKAVAIATVFVDEKLRITRFTPEATQLFNIRDADIGRPLGDFTNRLEHSLFLDELRQTIAEGHALEHEILAGDDRRYLVRILPYELGRGGACGAVATFVDVTQVHDPEYLQAILDALPSPIALLTSSGRVAMVNAAWAEHGESAGAGWIGAGPGDDYLAACQAWPDGELAARLRQGIGQVLRGERTDLCLEYGGSPTDASPRFLLCAAPIDGGDAIAVVSQMALASTQHG